MRGILIEFPENEELYKDYILGGEYELLDDGRSIDCYKVLDGPGGTGGSYPDITYIKKKRFTILPDKIEDSTVWTTP